MIWVCFRYSLAENTFFPSFLVSLLVRLQKLDSHSLLFSRLLQFNLCITSITNSLTDSIEGKDFHGGGGLSWQKFPY